MFIIDDLISVAVSMLLVVLIISNIINYPFRRIRMPNLGTLPLFLSFPDFIIWEMLEQHEMFKPGCLADLPKLAAYHKRFKEEPKIKKFMESPKYFQGPCNNKMASWGGSYPVAPASF